VFFKASDLISAGLKALYPWASGPTLSMQIAEVGCSPVEPVRRDAGLPGGHVTFGTLPEASSPRYFPTINVQQIVCVSGPAGPVGMPQCLQEKRAIRGQEANFASAAFLQAPE